MPSSSAHVRNYDVFLSFRGEDTRLTIVSYLYEALSREGIFTFRDDMGLEAGNKISDRLIEVINTSWFAVVVISENYATSEWCLDELRLIMELHTKVKIQVVPIFYGVEPSNVRHQTGCFVAAFQEYEVQDMASERVSQWKRALNQIGHLSGFHFGTCVEADMIAKVVGSISSQLPSMTSTDSINLIGIEAHLVKMTLRLNIESEDEIRMIGIWGMGGIGKSTIAKCLYDRFSRRFQAHCFIEDIKKIHKDKCSSYLQERFLSSILGGQYFGFRAEARSREIKARLGHQKVFVVLDGVDKVEQVHALAKETSWFGPGSRIIITTRDKGLLNSCGVNNVYEVKCLDDKDALQVFETLAFGGRPPPSDGFEQVFIRASRLAHGLPSALVAYASYLNENTAIERWEDELGILETSPHKNVEKIVRNSYDGLDNQDKVAFLQVACLFNGYSFNHVTSLVDDGRPRMNHLIAKSLVSLLTDGCINMHFLAVQTGKAIVRKNSRKRPFRQMFLWDPYEIYDVLDNDIGTDEIEGVTLNMIEMPDKLHMSKSVFRVMHNLKFLKFFQHLGDAESNVKLESYGFYFPHNLRLLHWDAYPLKTLPSRFQQNHLVEINLRYSNLENLWNKTVNLRRLDVTGSENLRELPDLSTAMNFEELIIEGCMRLRKIPESIRRLNNLRKLNAIHCNTLRGVKFSVGFANNLQNRASWGTKLMLNFLTDLSIEGSMYIELFGLRGNTEHLSFGSTQTNPEQSITLEQKTVTTQLMLDSDSSNPLEFEQFSPESLEIKKFSYMEIKRFSYMENRAPFHCYGLENFPFLTQLKLINLNIKFIPADICILQCLETLDLEGNDFHYQKENIERLHKLKYLNLQNCRKLKALPHVTQVETLILSNCVNLVNLWDGDSTGNWGTYCLLELWLDNCKNVQRLSLMLSFLTKLTYLDLGRHDFVTVPSSIRGLSSLGALSLNNCKKLRSVDNLPQSLKHLYAHGCDSLELVSLPLNHSIKHLDLIHCPRLNQEEHKHLMNMFLDDKHSKEGSQHCACLLETGVSKSSGINYETSETSTKINRIINFFESLKSVFRRR